MSRRSQFRYRTMMPDRLGARFLGLSAPTVLLGAVALAAACSVAPRWDTAEPQAAEPVAPRTHRAPSSPLPLDAQPVQPISAPLSRQRARLQGLPLLRAAPPPPDSPPVTPPDSPPESTPSVADPESAGAEPEMPPTASEASEPVLVALAVDTRVYERPTFHSRPLGYLRTGAVVRRDPLPAGHDGCRLGFYRVMPEGYVCVGPAASLDPNHPLAELARERPDRLAPLPYRYARSLYPTPPLYTRLPTRAEQSREEPDLAAHLAVQGAYAWRFVSSDPLPERLAHGAPTPVPFGVRRDVSLASNGRALANSSFALLAVFEQAGRRFGLASDLTLLPLDRLKPIEPSSFQGVTLGAEHGLPLVFVRSRRAWLYAADPVGPRPLRLLGYREAVSISGRSRRIGHESYLETRTGELIRAEHLTRVDALDPLPSFAASGRSFIHVSIPDQTLVAYQGSTPVYATLVSTGADGLGDPASTRSTPRGLFVIHTKHVTTAMDSDEVGDEFDLRDVPYVQYFTEGYAFHAAYWHDAFGEPHSHGCVNLSPLDARWLFHWTDPPVPQRWHGAFSLRRGTLVYITG